MIPRLSLDKRFNLEGKVAVVVGGAGFLCSTLAKAMLESGMKVALLDLKPSAASEALAGPETLFLGTSATSKADLEKAREAVLSRFGRVDVLLNGAGTNAPTPFLDITETEMDGILSSHLKATVFGCQVFGELMIGQKGGAIVNFASASSGPPLSKAFIYSAAKSGIVSITQNLAREWAGIPVRVNALRPGFFPTEWSMKHFIDKDREGKILGHTPMGRYGKPEELIGATLWLLSDAASFVTGSIIAVDGGFTAMTI